MISSCSSQDLKFLSLQSRCKGGSLPLKKRRFCSISKDTVEGEAQHVASIPEAAPSLLGEGKLAALSLVASTAAAVPVASPDRALKPSSMEPPTVTIQDKAAAHMDKVLEEETESTVPPAKRIHSNVPLDQPLPGGCHGRTSRNNSFCRRQPCYNGSQFCKLHYQQQVLVEGAKSLPIKEDPASVASKRATSPVVEEKKAGAFQDKRYSGGSGEVRCKATTTRGRECAYVAVNCGKFCHLHADYDTNPPPRRGGGGGSSKKMANTSDPSETSDAMLKVQATASLASLGSSSSEKVAKTGTKGKTPADRSKKRGNGAKVAKKHVDSRFPLLSMISTDQWADKQVKISAGPLADRVGTVEKWSNGWVSVRVEGVGLHNRRSFELYLVDGEKCDFSSSKDSDSVDEKSKEAPVTGSSRITPSPSIGSEEQTPAKVKRPTAKMSAALRAPVTPSVARAESDWAITSPTPSGNGAPFVPSVTPNSPRRSRLGSEGKSGGPRLTEGPLLSDCTRSELALQLRVDQRLGGAVAFSSGGGKGSQG